MRTVLYLCCLMLLSFSVNADSAEDIERRIQPIGKVYLQDDTEDLQQQSLPKEVKQVQESKDVGQKIYRRFCQVCHQRGLAGAPVFRSEVWRSKLKQEGLDGLVKNAIKGIKAMPPKGTCMSCSQEDIRAAILYMIEEKK